MAWDDEVQEKKKVGRKNGEGGQIIASEHLVMEIIVLNQLNGNS